MNPQPGRRRERHRKGHLILIEPRARSVWVEDADLAVQRPDAERWHRKKFSVWSACPRSMTWASRSWIGPLLGINVFGPMASAPETRTGPGTPTFACIGPLDGQRYSCIWVG